MRAVLVLVCTLAMSTSVWAIPPQYESAITPAVKPYRIPTDLSGVRHMDRPEFATKSPGYGAFLIRLQW